MPIEAQKEPKTSNLPPTTDISWNPLPLEEVLGNPGTATAIVPPNPTSSGYAKVASKRWGGPINIAYEIHGTGPKHVVWIMGLNAPRIAWYREMGYFGVTKGREYTNLIFDNRGVGDSDSPWVRFTTSEMARDVLELCDALGWTGDGMLNVVGVSMGGMIAQELAYLAPQRIQSVVFQSTAPVLRIEQRKPFYRHFLNRLSMIKPKTLPERIHATRLTLFSLKWLSSPDSTGVYPTNGDRFAAEELWRMDNIKITPLRAYLQQALAASWHYMSQQRLAEVGRNVRSILLLHGSLDKMISVRHQEDLLEGLNSRERTMKWGMQSNMRRVELEGVGHCLQVEVTEEYHRLLEEFWKNCEATESGSLRFPSML